MKKLIIILFCLTLFGCATASYNETVSHWASYKDVSSWYDTHFHYSMSKWYAVVGKCGGKPDVKKCLFLQTAEETFKSSGGVCTDSAVFNRDTLNRINPSYEAKVVIMVRADMGYHFVCGFKMDGNLYIMDYGEVSGPFSSLNDYKERNTKIIEAHFYDKF